jgi:spermidine/putrescine ABC transporter ATP-binding subunit
MEKSKNEKILKLTNITKSFGELIALNNVSLSIDKGKIVTFVGPSGCGKTTLLRTIAGFCEPDEGEIVLDNENITNKPPKDRSTGMVFQNYALFPHLSVAKNIAFGLEIKKEKKKNIEKEVDRLLRLVKMEGLGKRKPHELSGGQQQRVALARALSLTPKILLLDEPLSNLDANLRILMREEIIKLQRRLGLSIVFVTHDQEEAMSISDLLVVMDQGKVKQIGSPVEIYETPIDEFVANFIGHINFFSGKIIELLENEMTFEVSEKHLKIKTDNITFSIGEKLKAVVRPEAIEIVSYETELNSSKNVIEGQIDVSMYSGSVLRYTIIAGDQKIYVDHSDPEHKEIFQEGSKVKLILKNRIHMLRD